MEIPKSTIPEGESGPFRVIKFNISKADADSYNWQLLYGGMGYRSVIPGEYTSLTCNRVVVMSDTRAEINDHRDFYHSATGDVLINGLGLGLIARAVMLKPNVNSVTINEINEDVIKLVYPHLKAEFGEKLILNQVDAFCYHPNGNRFNSIWHDIWNDICTDNIEEYKFLMRRYGKWAKQPRYHNCWCYDDLKRLRREGR